MAPSSYSALSQLECASCATTYDPAQVHGTCACGSPLLARYDTERVAAKVSPAEIATRPPDLWRYHELLPVSPAANGVPPGGGMNPPLPIPPTGPAPALPRLSMNDQSPLPPP